MEQQDPTTENKQENTSRRWQADRRALSGEPQNAYEPHYMVITGTNIRSTLPGKDFTPKVYDSEATAFAAVDAENEHRKRMADRAITPRSPISVTEYDWKYSAYVNTPKE